MARKSREEIIERFTAYAGDRNDDETLGILEDLSDSYGDDSKELETVRAELEDLRNRYKARFRMGSGETLETVQETTQESKDEVDDTTENEVTFEKIFFEED